MSFRTVVEFLRELNKNNDKAWMDEHRSEYEAARDFVIDWTEQLNEALASTDSNYEPTSGKKAISRINNNLLYHPNLPTYKDHFGIELNQGGGDSAFYIQIGTSHSFIGGGYYKPSKEQLGELREAIAQTGDQLKKIVNKKSFASMFGELNDENKLKTAPRGYDQDHQHIDLLRLKSYAVMHAITQEESMADDFIDRVVEIYEEMLPFSQYLNKAVS
ncbi:MAG: DUF2461 domain-containing protein [Cyanobacteria bacterium J06560_6]